MRLIAKRVTTVAGVVVVVMRIARTNVEYRRWEWLVTKWMLRNGQGYGYHVIRTQMPETAHIGWIA